MRAMTSLVQLTTALGAVIALRRAREKGQHLPSGSARVVELSYRLARATERLTLERWLVWANGREQLLRAPQEQPQPDRQDRGYATTANAPVSRIRVSRWLDCERRARPSHAVPLIKKLTLTRAHSRRTENLGGVAQTPVGRPARA